MRAIALVLCAVLAVAAASNSEKKVVCYYGSWASNRPGNGKFAISNIDAKLCTHLIYSFVSLSNSGDVVHSDVAGLNQFVQLRKQSPSTKIMVAMGGYTFGSATFSSVVANVNLRRRMVDSIVQFVKQYDLDGFDLDWEYPAQREGSRPADKHNLVVLLKELRERFDREGLILSAAVAVAEFSASQSYDIAGISKYLHFINLMAYDLHGSWESKTGMNSPLYSGPWESSFESQLNVDSVIKYWLSQGAPAEKLVLGVPFYGRGFTLANPKSNGIAAPTAGPSRPGPYTGEGGFLGYNEICEKVKNEKWQVVFNDVQRVPYAFSHDQWIGYDNERSLKEKTNVMKTRGLGGAMVWSIETDDFLGKCGEKYPLLNTLNRELRSGVSTSDEPAYPQPQPEEPQYVPDYEDDQPQYEPDYQTDQPQQQVPNNSGDLCQSEGYVVDPVDQSKYYYCQYYNNAYNPLPMQCPAPLVYNAAANQCVWR